MQYGEIATFAAGIALLVGSIAIGILVEKIFPAAACPISGVVFNVAYIVPATVLKVITISVVAGGAVTMTNVLGGGLITLPSEGWLLVPAAAAYTMAMDFGEYLFHRAQHRIPAMWAMHSLHHSDTAMNISTTQRHFWAEQAIKTVTVYLLVGLLFKANAPILTFYGIISFCNLFFHMNVPIGFGPGWCLLNSPQYHRVHHSSLPEHQDRNFAALFPIFDVIFGAAYRPHPGEFPQTGLHDGDSPRSVLEAFVWPARNLYRRQLLASHRS